MPIKSCPNCRRAFVPNRTHKRLCADCPRAKERRGDCPSCGKALRLHSNRGRRRGPCVACKSRIARERRICSECGGSKSKESALCVRCNNQRHRGERSRAWRGGRHLNGDGYVMLWCPEHPRAGKRGYVREHIKVWTDAHGPLLPGWTVHHLNGIRDDNRLDNLAAVPPGANKSFHLQRLMAARVRDLEMRLVEMGERCQSAA